MASLFGGGGSSPAPQPIPVNPVNDSAAQKARQDAERAAIVDAKHRGRASTIVAGGDIASEEQYGRGLLSAKKRSGAASAGLLG